MCWLADKSSLLGTRAPAPGNRPARPTLGAGIRARPLTPHGQVPPMALTSIRANFRQTLDVHRHSTPKITFNFELSVNELTNADNLALCQIPNPSVGIHTGVLQNLLASAESDAIDMG
jgi:hypothetical protein